MRADSGLTAKSTFRYGLSHTCQRCLSTEGFRAWYLSCLSSAPVTQVSDLLCSLHDATVSPWWFTIAAGTMVLRTVGLAPAHVTAQKTAAKRMVLFNQMDKELIPFLRQKIRQKQLQKGWSDQLAKQKFDK